MEAIRQSRTPRSRGRARVQLKGCHGEAARRVARGHKTVANAKGSKSNPKERRNPCFVQAEREETVHCHLLYVRAGALCVEGLEAFFCLVEQNWQDL